MISSTCPAARPGQIYFLRHGQSVFNNAVEPPPKGWGLSDVLLWDGPLTTLGLLQAKAAREVVNAIPNLGLIVVSPLTRECCSAACCRLPAMWLAISADMFLALI